MKISIIGKFYRLYDEEYIAKSFESLGHEVQRLPEKLLTHQFIGFLDAFKPDVVLCTKLFVAEPLKLSEYLKKGPWKFVSWNFDLYWGYPREERIKTTPGFRANYVFTTDGGHDEKWKDAGIKHQCVRQGIYAPECYLAEGSPDKEVVFIGSLNTLYPYRQETMNFLQREYDFHWFGKLDTHQLRGDELNRLYATSKVVVGDSVDSPYYWSNRVVETLGRGGFLIHQEVDGLKEEYPHLVTYKRGDLNDLKEKIDYYIEHEDERKALVVKNYEWVRDNYTMDKKCAELLSKL